MAKKDKKYRKRKPSPAKVPRVKRERKEEKSHDKISAGYEADTEGAEEEMQLNDQCITEFKKLMVDHHPESSSESDGFWNPQDMGYEPLTSSDASLEPMDADSDTVELVNAK